MKKKIKSLNIFKSVNSEIVDGSNPATKIININVEEKPIGLIVDGQQRFSALKMLENKDFEDVHYYHNLTIKL